MKTILIIINFLCYIISLAQPVVTEVKPLQIPFADVKEKNKINDKFMDQLAVDQNVAGWEKLAKITIIDVDKDVSEKIKMVTRSKRTSISSVYDDQKKELNFDLANLIKDEKENSFVVILDGQENGTIRLKVTFTKATSDAVDQDSKNVESYIGALTNANFTGNNKFLSNLTPIVNLGNVLTLIEKKNFKYQLDINPYIGSDIEAKTPNTFIPALMLYGKAGLSFNNYLKFNVGTIEFIVSPISMGLKVIPSVGDSAKTIIQHNIRPGIAFRIADFFSISSQMTFGWHNITSESKANFKYVSGKDDTKIRYLTTIGQFAIKGKDDKISNYIYLEWRVLLSQESYSAYSNNQGFLIKPFAESKTELAS